MMPIVRLAALAFLLAPSLAGAEPAGARPWIALEAGLGQSVGLEQDYLVVSAGPRLALGGGAHRFIAGARLAVALNASLLPKRSHNVMSGTPVLVDLDAAGYEHRFGSGLALSASVGVTVPLGGGKFWDNENQRLGDEPALRAQLGVGYRF